MTIGAWAENNARPVKERAGCEVPGCQCNGRVEYMDWSSEDMTETDDSEYEDPVDRDNRLYVESCNYDLSEGMTPMTYTPPLRRNRRRRYEVRKKYETDMEDSICGTIDDGFLTDEESPNSEHMVQPMTVADNVNRTVRNRNNNRGGWSWPGSENDITSDENSNLFDRPVTESATAGAGIETDSLSVEHVKCCEIPVTELITVRVPDTKEPLIMRVSTITTELSELGTSACSETDISDIPVFKECVIPERRRPVKVSTDADTQVVISDYQRSVKDYCFGVCEETDSINRSGIGWCWDCLGWLMWGYRVSCLVAIVIKDRSYGIDLYTEERRVYTSGLGLVGDPMMLCDTISVYTMMNENFKGGLNNVMLRNKDPVDSRYHQRCVNNGHEMGTRASVYRKPIRVRGRFRCLYSPIRDADWSDVCSVDLSPVGDVRIEYIGDECNQEQSTDAAPLTELQDLHMLLHIYSDCATGFTSVWTFCVTVQDISCGEEFTRHGSDLSVCQTMDGAALVDDRSGVTFRAELCIPWDAPEAVVDIDSAELVSLGSLPDKVGLFGRRKDAAVSRILAGRDSSSVRFLVPDRRVVDVTVVDMEDEREPMVVMEDMTRLRELWPVEVFDHMKWYQQDLELMRKSAKKEYSQIRPMPCRFCGKVIRVDMYRHVARLHLDLVQLWRCPIAWCTTWKGSPQDCLEHLRSGHDAPWISKTASIEKYAPPWTVRRELWTDSLRVEHSGISTDMLLFSEVGLSLTQHYRVYKGGLPHAVFRTDYMERLRSLLRSSGQSGSPPETGRASTPKSVRRLFSEAVDDGPFLIMQNPADVVGETIIDCRPSVLPVLIPLSGLSPGMVSEVRECVSYRPSEETGKSIMDMDTNEITINRIRVGRGGY